MKEGLVEENINKLIFTEPNITLLDTSKKSVDKSSNFVDEWIKDRL